MVANSHMKSTHLGLTDTLEELKKYWIVDLRSQGISCKAFIDVCGCQMIQSVTTDDMLITKLKHMIKLQAPLNYTR